MEDSIGFVCYELQGYWQMHGNSADAADHGMTGRSTEHITTNSRASETPHLVVYLSGNTHCLECRLQVLFIV